MACIAQHQQCRRTDRVHEAECACLMCLDGCRSLFLRYVTWFAGVTLPKSGIHRRLDRALTYGTRNYFHALCKLVHGWRQIFPDFQISKAESR
jgi:hypothetical protein